MIKASPLPVTKTNFLKPEILLLLLLMLVNVVSVFGFATFGLHPQMLTLFSWAPWIFSYSYIVFARVQIIVAFLALGAFLSRKKLNHNWFPLFLAVFVLSLSMELGGTTYGFPFGKYGYTDLLGWKIADKVPFLIPVSWFFMSFASYVIAYLMAANIKLAGKGAVIFRIMAGSLLLTSWDLTLDPAMSKLSPFWIWEEEGIYFGTPLINLVGWFFTGLFIMALMELFKTKNSFASYEKSDFNWVIYFFLANLFLPFGMVIFSGLWLPVAFTICVFMIVMYFFRPSLQK